MVLTLVGLGLFAGSLTTVAGVGGGQLLILALAALFDPGVALVVSAPALLLGTAHRVALYRREIDWSFSRPFIAGAFPAATAGGLLAVTLPSLLISILLVVSTSFAVARAAGWIVIRPPRAALPVAGLGIGLLCATSSGASLLLTPILLCTGSSGTPYIATGAVCMAAMHIGRLMGYGVGGWLGAATTTMSLLVATAILIGNLIGDRLRGHIPAVATPWIEHGTLAACVLLAVVQLGH
jgi:uncharacterized membrane protein YfcA